MVIHFDAWGPAAIAGARLFAQEGAPAADGAGGLAMLPLFAMLGLLFYFMVLAPERRKQKQHQALLGSLKKNDRVTTVGGIRGVVDKINRDANEVTLKVDEATNTKIRVDISSIGRVESDDAGEAKNGSTRAN